MKQKNKLLNNAKNFYEGREKIIKGFKNKVFSLYYDQIYEQMDASAKEEEEKRRKKEEQKNKIKNHLIQKKLLNGCLIEKNYPYKMNCLKNILNFKNLLLCIEFCTKQIMIKKKIVH